MARGIELLHTARHCMARLHINSLFSSQLFCAFFCCNWPCSCQLWLNSAHFISSHFFLLSASFSLSYFLSFFFSLSFFLLFAHLQQTHTSDERMNILYCSCLLPFSPILALWPNIYSQPFPMGSSSSFPLRGGWWGVKPTMILAVAAWSNKGEEGERTWSK